MALLFAIKHLYSVFKGTRPLKIDVCVYMMYVLFYFFCRDWFCGLT